MSDLAPATIHFCEARLSGAIAEPANTWSSLGYVVVGLWLLLSERGSKRGVGRRWPLAIVAIAEIGIGIGSIAMHGTGTFVGEVLDLSGMFLLSACMLALGLGRLRRWSDRAVVAAWLGFFAAPLVGLALARSSGIPSFAAELVAAIACEVALRLRGSTANFGLFGQALALLGLAFGSWVVDIARLVCDPNNHILGGHAVWHLVNAFSIERLFTFYARELGPTGRRHPLVIAAHHVG